MDISSKPPEQPKEEQPNEEQPNEKPKDTPKEEQYKYTYTRILRINSRRMRQTLDFRPSRRNVEYDSDILQEILDYLEDTSSENVIKTFHENKHKLTDLEETVIGYF